MQIKSPKAGSRTEEFFNDTYRVLLENTPDIISLITLEGEIQLINRTLPGFDKEAVIGSTVFDFIPAAYHQQVRDCFKQVLETGKQGVYEIEGEGANGSTAWYSTRICPIFENGKITAFTQTATDITEKIQTAKALRETEEKLRKAFHTSPDSININRMSDGMYVDINEGFTQITGYNREDVIGKTSLDLNIWANPEDRETLVEGLTKHKRVDNLEAKFRMKNGSTITGLMSATIIELNDVPHILSVTRNIEEIKKTQEALEKSEKNLSLIFDTVGDVLFQLAVEPDDCFRFLAVNRNFLIKTGLTENQIIGKRYDEVIPAAAHKLAVAKYKEAIAKKQTVVWEETSDYPTGRLTGIVSVTPAVNEAGLCTHLIGSVHDITARKAAENALQQSRERYLALFEESPVPLWEEDFSEIAKFILALKKKHVKNFRRYFDKRPETVAKCATMVKIQDVNKAVLALHEAKSKHELFVGLAKIFTVDSYPIFKEQLLAIADGKTVNESEAIVKTLTGKEKYISLKWQVVPGYEQTLSRVFLSTADITERKKSEAALQEKTKQIKALSQRLLNIQERERRSIANELHDEIGQTLTAVKLNLQTIRQDRVPIEIKTRLSESINMVDSALEQVRNLSLNLRPSILDDLGLAPALRWFVDHNARFHPIKITLNLGVFPGRLPPDIEIVCFRVVQEAFTNVTRHAKAKNIWIRLTPAPNTFELIIGDDGAGFDVDREQQLAIRGKSLGLLGMQERVILAGGTFKIKSRKGEGTEIRIKFPREK